MQLGGNKTRKVKAGAIRQGQLVTTFGCGSIVDMPGESVIIAGTDYWKHFENDDRFKLSEVNLQKYLGVDYFISPPPAQDDKGYNTGYGIPAFRFPEWMYCPKCNRLARISTFDTIGHPKCQKCNVRVIPSRFVIACENGHLDDFPYEWWVHQGNKCTSTRPELYFQTSEKSSGLDSVIIYCKTCGAERSMAGSFSRDALRGFKCRGRRPWLKDRDKKDCDQKVRTMQRGATNLHFSITTSALSIPPWSKHVQMELDKKWNVLECLMDDEEFFKRTVEKTGLNERCKCSLDDLWEQAVLKKKGEESDVAKTWQEILEGEYRAFLGGSSDERDEFKTRNVDVPEFIIDYVDQVVLATRLREVVALRGFKRISPDYDIDQEESFTRISRDFKNWLPAVELKGEGIFIKLNQQKLEEWEQNHEVVERYKKIETQGQKFIEKGPGFSPRYVLLHTLSHLLIRQLILECGYASAAIKERIYCSFIQEEEFLDMAGILIYTASNDSEGSLGGLVREGKTNRFDNTFRLMIEAASWCSADPLCIQSEGQGLDALNLAACHSCTLLPETSCESRNCLLDRASVIGTLENSSIGFFSKLLTRR